MGNKTMHDKPLCPYCGPWNGHPDGVEMIPIKSPRFLPDKTRILGTFYKCPCCGARSPWEHMQDVAFASALRRFQPMQKPLTLEEIVELQKAYKNLFDSKRLTKKAMCDLVVPFRDKYNLSDLTALRVARGEFSLEQIAKLIASCVSTAEERAAAKWEEETT